MRPGDIPVHGAANRWLQRGKIPLRHTYTPHNCIHTHSRLAWLVWSEPLRLQICKPVIAFPQRCSCNATERGADITLYPLRHTSHVHQAICETCKPIGAVVKDPLAVQNPHEIMAGWTGKSHVWRLGIIYGHFHWAMFIKRYVRHHAVVYFYISIVPSSHWPTLPRHQVRTHLVIQGQVDHSQMSGELHDTRPTSRGQTGLIKTNQSFILP